MAKVFKAREEPVHYIFYCPGCKLPHVFDQRWTFSGDVDSPTFSPSLLCNPDHESSRCHLFVRDGRIEFLNDCFHSLAGQTVAMTEWTDECW